MSMYVCMFVHCASNNLFWLKDFQVLCDNDELRARGKTVLPLLYYLHFFFTQFNYFQCQADYVPGTRVLDGRERKGGKKKTWSLPIRKLSVVSL